MKYCSTLIAVTDMERSKQFYRDLLGLEVLLDFGANVTLTGGIALPDCRHLDRYDSAGYPGADLRP